MRRSESGAWIDRKSIIMSPILALEKISKHFGAIVIADGLDLALTEGEALGIIGPNGAGKTTLFGIMTGTVAADAGRVLLDGVDITRAPPPRRCTMGIARSFQIPQPFGGMTVFENLVVAAAFGSGCRQGQPLRRLARADRSQAARTCARARDLAACAAAGRSRGRADRT